jgi:hypothetical protein
VTDWSQIVDFGFASLCFGKNMSTVELSHRDGFAPATVAESLGNGFADIPVPNQIFDSLGNLFFPGDSFIGHRHQHNRLAGRHLWIPFRRHVIFIIILDVFMSQVESNHRFSLPLNSDHYSDYHISNKNITPLGHFRLSVRRGDIPV